MNRDWMSRAVISVVALHSIVLGLCMLLVPAWTLRMAGWSYDGPLFFPAQSGIFLIILGGAYLAALRDDKFAWLLVATKAAAVLFLLACFFLDAAPPLILLATAGDGLMGAAVAYLLWSGQKQERPAQAISSELEMRIAARVPEPSALSGDVS